MKELIVITLFALAIFTVFSPATAHAASAKAIFAGGCFWCMESDFEKIDGVQEVVSGYTGGTTEEPSYKQVSTGGTGHYEVVEITYDPDVITYKELLDHFWINVDPTDGGGQFCDRGDQYRSAIFYLDEEQKLAAEKSKQELEDSKKLNLPVATPIIKGAIFYPAEGYHQNYYKKNPIRYKFYRSTCGRNNRLKELWGDK